MDRSINVKVDEFYKGVPQVSISVPNLISATLNPIGMFKFNNGNTVFVVNFEEITHIAPVFPLLTLNK